MGAARFRDHDRAITVILLLARLTAAQEHVWFPTRDGALVHADLYGKGDQGVVLAHGGRFNKESWKKQAQALEQAGLHVLAIDYRVYGKSSGPGKYEKAPGPQELIILEGSAHAQFLFATDQGERVMREILRLLSEK
jgi:pimeloyl-ACP methyl ester carboxylesterase